ncbi:uncharacterized protein [Euwallacea similis]|uniref:uncharacterized protein n=1 Tax=Euwallacea similis TaxID=1736056 RepID=UPI00344FAB8B
MIRTSIIPGILFLLLAGEVHARNLWSNYDDSALQPIISQSRRTRICYELCTSGLGGTPCGDSCFDLIPTNLPIAVAGQDQDSQNGSGYSSKYNATTREASCKVLCKNGLGYPLCTCNDEDTTKPTDFFAVCSSFCVNYSYQLYGCQNCTLYLEYMTNNINSNNPFDMASLGVDGTVTIGWNAWCREMCSDGNGGAACNCDLLP